ncbi:MAG: VCBS repeat-containing protein [Bacteroidota bacterium]|jgi:hypothetical protein
MTKNRSQFEDMKHIDETTLELFVLRSPEIDAQRSAIERHLQECAGCSELYDAIASFYADVAHELSTTEELLPVRAEVKLEKKHRISPALRMVEIAFPFRVARWVARHPYRAAGSGITVIALAVALTLFIPKVSFTDKNPAYVKNQNDSLQVYNRNNELLWKRYLGFKLQEPNRELHGYVVQVVDVDRDGSNEVILIAGLGGIYSSPRDSIFCFESDGGVRWSRKLGKQIKFGDREFTNDYYALSFQSGDFDNDGEIELLVYAHHTTWEPAVLTLLSGKDGTTKGEFWHRGHMESLLIHENNNGTKDIIVGAQNNSFDEAALMILDPRHIAGSAPSMPFDPCSDQVSGKEKYFLLFPRTDLELKIGSHPRNTTSSLGFSDSVFTAVVSEAVEWQRVGLYYDFNTQMHCVAVHPSDDYRAEYEKCVMAGKLKPMVKDYFENIRKDILYWDGDKFVHEPTMNRRYFETVATR